MLEWIIPLSIIGLIMLGIQLKNYPYPSQIQKEFIKEFNKEWEQINMTERFTYVRGDGFTDNGKHINPYEVTDLLNVLSTENRQLKKQLETEHQMLDNAILLERTRMGKNSLKQYKEAIQ